MIKTCNLSTVKNTPSGARRSTLRAEYYYIRTVQSPDCDDDVQYRSIQCIIDMIYNILEYSDLSVLNNAVIFRHSSDETDTPLYMLKNDVIKHSFRIIKFNR